LDHAGGADQNLERGKGSFCRQAIQGLPKSGIHKRRVPFLRLVQDFMSAKGCSHHFAKSVFCVKQSLAVRAAFVKMYSLPPWELSQHLGNGAELLGTFLPKAAIQSLDPVLRCGPSNRTFAALAYSEHCWLSAMWTLPTFAFEKLG